MRRLPNGLWVPSKSFPAMERIAGTNQFDGVSPVLQPVVVVDDLSAITSSIQNLTVVTQAQATQPSATRNYGQEYRSRWFRCLLYKKFVGTELNTPINYTWTVPDGQDQKFNWLAIGWATQTTNALRMWFEQNPLDTLAAAYGAGNFRHELSFVGTPVINKQYAVTLRFAEFDGITPMSSLWEAMENSARYWWDNNAALNGSPDTFVERQVQSTSGLFHPGGQWKIHMEQVGNAYSAGIFGEFYVRYV